MSSLTQLGFRLLTHAPLETWAPKAGSAALRRFQFRRESLITASFFDTDAIERNETVILTVAYPALPALYGVTDLDAVEEVMRADARIIRDTITVNLLSSGHRMTVVTVLAPATTGATWFQRFELLIIYAEAQTLS